MRVNVFEGFRRFGYVIIILLTTLLGYTFSQESTHTFSRFLELAAVPVGFFVFMKITGWIVRGFFGIPMGKDFKE